MLFFIITYSKNLISDAKSNIIQDTSFVTNPKAVDPAPASITESPFMSSLEFILSLSVLIFGLIIVGLEIYLIRTKEIDADMLVKFIVVTLIITGTLFLITAGYNNNQIAPAVGLFGTVAGYLLGKSTSNTNKNENS
jgi:hypothetical protein